MCMSFCCPSVCPSVCVYLFFCVSVKCPSALPICFSACLWYISNCLYMYNCTCTYLLPVGPTVCLLVLLPIYMLLLLRICLFILLSICFVWLSFWWMDGWMDGRYLPTPVHVYRYNYYGAWWLIARFGVFRPKGRRFDPRSSRQVGTLISPSLAVACGASAWNSDAVSVLRREVLCVVVDLKRGYKK